MTARLLGWLLVFGLALGLAALEPPLVAEAAVANDDFESATQVTALPFTEAVDTTTATLEPGEPPAPFCGFGMSSSVWYRFTPQTSGSIVIRATAFGFSAEAMAYRGTSLNTLTSIDCASFNNPTAIGVVAGETYYFQVGPLFGATGTIAFSVDVAPPLHVAFGITPSDPSSFDVVNFSDQSFDEGLFTRIESCTWDFGGADTDNSCFTSRQFAADGDYSVTHIATSHDGRTGSVTQVVHVRTHDVAIAGFNVPKTAMVGSTHRITVEISNTRYPETVRVGLAKSLPSTLFVQVAETTVSVPVGTATRTTKIAFDYTFTAEDATLGKVTFEASVMIVGARDALPTDNAVFAPITVVRTE